MPSQTLASNRSNLALTLILSVLSPLMGLIVSVNRFSWHYKKWLLILIITIFGSIFQYPELADASRHQGNVYEHYANLEFTQFLHELWLIITFRPDRATNDDVYIHIISYFTGTILGAPGLFFIVVSFVFGYFYASAMKRVFTKKYTRSKSILFFGMSLLFITINFVDNMQTVRTWTGAWVLFNGFFGYIETKKFKYLILMGCAPMIHIAYAAMAIPAYAMIFIKNINPKILIGIYLLSFFASFGHTGILNVLKSTEVGANKVEVYYQSEDDLRYSVSVEKDNNWYAKYGKVESPRIGINALVISVILLGLFNKKRMTVIEFRLFSLGILMIAWANFGSFIEAFYNRTTINAGLYVIAATTLLVFRGEINFDLPKRFHKLAFSVCLIIFVPFFIFKASSILSFCSAYFLAFPFVAWFYENLSFREFIGYFL